MNLLVLVAGAIVILALAIIVAASVIGSAIRAAAMVRVTNEQQAVLLTLAPEQQEAFKKASAALDKIGDGVYSTYLQMFDHNNFNDFKRLVRAIEVYTQHLEKLTIPPADHSE